MCSWSSRTSVTDPREGGEISSKRLVSLREKCHWAADQNRLRCFTCSRTFPPTQVSLLLLICTRSKMKRRLGGTCPVIMRGKKRKTETYIHHLLIIQRRLNDAFIRRWRKSNKFWNIKVPKTNSARLSHKSHQQLIIYRPAYRFFFFFLPLWCEMWADYRIGHTDQYRNASQTDKLGFFLSFTNRSCWIFTS